MADDSFVEPKASEEPYTRIKTLGRGAFGEAVLYRKTEVGIRFVSLQFTSLQANIASKTQHVFFGRALAAVIKYSGKLCIFRE